MSFDNYWNNISIIELTNLNQLTVGAQFIAPYKKECNAGVINLAFKKEN